MVLHPFLFGVFPILTFFALLAMMQDTVDCLLVPVLSALLCTVVLYALWFLLLRASEKAALATTICWCFIYSTTITFMASVGLQLAGCGWAVERWQPAFLGMVGAALAGVLILTVVSKRPLPKLTGRLNQLSVFLLVLELMVIGGHELKDIVQNRPRLNAIIAEELNLVPAAVPTRPDVYYIILDEMAGPRSLKELFAYDDSGFIDALRKRRFYVPAESRSNYVRTLLSLASSLNMMYLGEVGTIFGAANPDFAALSYLVRDNRVSRVFRRLGYRLIQLGSGAGATAWNPYADDNIECGPVREFSSAFLQSTVLGLDPQLVGCLRDVERQQRLHALSRLSEVAAARGPKFVFAHLLLPHDPYVFNADGGPGAGLKPSRAEPWSAESRQAYIEQVKFTEKRILAIIDQLLAGSQEPPIIVLQGDHGSIGAGTVMDPRPGPRFIKERTDILNAYFLPGSGNAPFYETISPVNTFRALFDRYFNGRLPLLHDRVYWSPFSRPFDFTDETSLVSPVRTKCPLSSGKDRKMSP